MEKWDREKKRSLFKEFATGSSGEEPKTAVQGDKEEPPRQTAAVSSAVKGFSKKPLELMQNLRLNAKGRLPIIAGAAVVLIIAIYFGYGMYKTQQYEAKKTELVATMADMQTVFSKVGGLSGENDDSSRQTVLADLNKAADKLKEQNEFFAAYDKDDVDVQKLAVLAEENKQTIQSVIDIVSFENITSGPTNAENAAKFKQMLANYTENRDKLNDGLSKFSRILGSEPNELLNLAKLNKEVQSYIDSKTDADRRVFAARATEYASRLVEKNNALRKNNEVTFLVQNVTVEGNSLKVMGWFYNGTAEQIAGVQSMLVDVTLKNYDEELWSVKDFKYANPIFTNMTIAPGKSSYFITLEIPINAQPKFDNFDVKIHKIQWKTRRIVRR